MKKKREKHSVPCGSEWPSIQTLNGKWKGEKIFRITWSKKDLSSYFLFNSDYPQMYVFHFLKHLQYMVPAVDTACWMALWLFWTSLNLSHDRVLTGNDGASRLLKPLHEDKYQPTFPRVLLLPWGSKGFCFVLLLTFGSEGLRQGGGKV